MKQDGQLEQGDVIAVTGEGRCIVDYVNSTGARVIPLTPVIRTVNAHDKRTGESKTVQFKQAPNGFTISAHSAVQLLGRVQGYTSRADRRHGIMGTREGALKAAATRAKNRAAEQEVELAKAPKAGKSKSPKMEAAPAADAAPAALATGTPLTPQEQAELEARIDAAPQAPAQAQSDDTDAGADPDLVNVAPEPGVDLSEGAATDMAKNGKANGKSAGKSAARARAPKAEKTVKPCACGCGEQTGGFFVQGHDARFKGWMLKIERGEEKKSALLKPGVIKSYDWVGTKGGGERTTTNYKGEKHGGYDKKGA